MPNRLCWSPTCFLAKLLHSFLVSALSISYTFIWLILCNDLNLTSSFLIICTWLRNFPLLHLVRMAWRMNWEESGRKHSLPLLHTISEFSWRILESLVYFQPLLSVPNGQAVTPLKLVPVGFRPVTLRRFGISEVVAWGQNLSHWIEFVPRCKPESKQNVIKCNVIERKTSVCIRMLRHLVSKAVLSKRLSTIAWRYEF
jgi:hypothetical protein